MSDKPGVDKDAEERGHEADVLWNKTVTASGLGLLGLILLGMLVLYIGLRTFASGRTIPRPEDQWQRIQVGVGVTPNQTLDRQKIESAERAWLYSYGWQDEDQEVAHIPIDRAIEWMVDRHEQGDQDDATESTQTSEDADERTQP